MTFIGQPERATQNRVTRLFRDELGYRYLGKWIDRFGNSNIVFARVRRTGHYFLHVMEAHDGDKYEQ